MHRENYLVRLLMCGDSSSGKTSLVLRFTSNEFSHHFVSTIGVDFRTLKTRLGERDCTVQVWDTAGQERYSSLTSSFFNRADGVCLTFDCSSRSSFQRVQHWWAELSAHKVVGSDVNAIILCTKVDLPSESREVSAEEGRSLAKTYGVPYFETSSKNGTGVIEAFSALAVLIMDRRYPYSIVPNQQPRLRSDEAEPPFVPAALQPVYLRPDGRVEPTISSGPCC